MVPTATEASNPFVTRRVRPGAIPFVFPTGVTVESLAEQVVFGDGSWQIVGPHGAGKSTLLATLLPCIESYGLRAERFTLRNDQRRLPVSSAMTKHWDTKTIVVVDGYEQLQWWSRWRLKRLVTRQRCRLIVTTHDSVGMRELFHVRPDKPLAREIVDGLLPAENTMIGDADVDAAFDQHQGNLREMLFTLYDLYEQRRVR